MSVLGNYFTNRYVDRLEELRVKILKICTDTEEGKISDEEYKSEFMKIYNQFTSTTSMHIKGLEKQNVSTDDSDMKYTKFMTKDWLISYLSYNVETTEIQMA